MAKGTNRAQRLNAAIDRLAGLFEFGQLMVATEPDKLLEMACDEIEELRSLPASFPAVPPQAPGEDR